MLTSEAFQIRQLQENGQVLIPDPLRDAVTDPTRIVVVPFDITLGPQFEDGAYQPDVSLLFVEQGSLADPTTSQEDHDHWGKLINHHRYLATLQRKISFSDRVLASLMAHQHGRGVELLTYVQIAALRRTTHHIGQAFLQNLETVLRRLGAEYIFGYCVTESRGFYDKLGWIPRETLPVDCNLTLTDEANMVRLLQDNITPRPVTDLSLLL